MLKLENVYSGYEKDINVINDVSLKVEKESIVGIIGANGAGKSTLLKTIYGILKPSQGKIMFENCDITGKSPPEIKKSGISFITQEHNVFPHMSVMENLLMGAWLNRKNPSKINDNLEKIFNIFPELRARANVNASFLSGGQLKMLCIAKELMTQPKMLLVDEPSCGLAPALVSKVYDILTKLTEMGITILLVDQNIRKAVEICDYLYVLDLGRIKMEGPRDLFVKNLREIVKSMIGGS